MNTTDKFIMKLYLEIDNAFGACNIIKIIVRNGNIL